LAKLFQVGKQMRDAILAVVKYVKDTTGIEPSQEEIALSLKCNFILSEIKNQIDWQRQGSKKTNETKSKPG